MVAVLYCVACGEPKSIDPAECKPPINHRIDRTSNAASNRQNCSLKPTRLETVESDQSPVVLSRVEASSQPNIGRKDFGGYSDAMPVLGLMPSDNKTVFSSSPLKLPSSTPKTVSIAKMLTQSCRVTILLQEQDNFSECVLYGAEQVHFNNDLERAKTRRLVSLGSMVIFMVIAGVVIVVFTLPRRQSTMVMDTTVHSMMNSMELVLPSMLIDDEVHVQDNSTSEPTMLENDGSVLGIGLDFFDLKDDTWIPQASLPLLQSAIMALNSDRRVVAVSTGDGAVHVFDWQDVGAWKQRSNLRIGSGRIPITSLSVWHDGSIVSVAASEQRAVVYQFVVGIWQQVGRKMGVNQSSPTTINLSNDGYTITLAAMSETGPGVQVYSLGVDYDWHPMGQELNLVEMINSRRGLSSVSSSKPSVSVSLDSNGYAIAICSETIARVFIYAENRWIQIGSDIPGGHSLSLLSKMLVVGQNGVGRLYRYHKGSWKHTQVLESDHDSVALNSIDRTTVSISGTSVGIERERNSATTYRVSRDLP